MASWIAALAELYLGMLSTTSRRRQADSAQSAPILSPAFRLRRVGSCLNSSRSMQIHGEARRGRGSKWTLQGLPEENAPRRASICRRRARPRWRRVDADTQRIDAIAAKLA